MQSIKVFIEETDKDVVLSDDCIRKVADLLEKDSTYWHFFIANFELISKKVFSIKCIIN
jgi:hypothetical protein